MKRGLICVQIEIDDLHFIRLNAKSNEALYERSNFNRRIRTLTLLNKRAKVSLGGISKNIIFILLDPSNFNKNIEHQHKIELNIFSNTCFEWYRLLTLNDINNIFYLMFLIIELKK